MGERVYIGDLCGGVLGHSIVRGPVLEGGNSQVSACTVAASEGRQPQQRNPASGETTIQSNRVSLLQVSLWFEILLGHLHNLHVLREHSFGSIPR